MAASSPIRVVIFADHEIGERIVRKILESASYAHFTVAAVVTTEENGHHWWPAIEPLALAHHMPLFRYPSETAQIEKIDGVDVFFFLSWKHIMSESILDMPRIGCINLHYSLLPKYRGVYPVNQALIHGDAHTGVSYHWMNKGIDAGNIVCQKALPILATDTARSLQRRLDDLAYTVFDEMVGLLETSGQPQNEAHASYFSRKDFEATNRLDINKTYRAIDLINLLRGKSFPPHGKNLYLEQEDGSKFYLTLQLEQE